MKRLLFVLTLIIIASGYIIPLIPIFTSRSWSYSVDFLGGSQIKTAISSDGEYIVGTSDNDLMLFHRSSPIPLWSYRTVVRIGSVVISSNGSYIATLSDKLYVAVTNLAPSLSNSFEESH